MSTITAGILITSDGILHNQKSDHISKYLIKELNSLRYNVGKITVVPEQVNVISNELEFMVKNCDLIITVGGMKCSNIYKAIGGIISQELEQSSELVKILEEIREPYDDDDIFIPIQAKILSGYVYPVIHFQRIFILNEKHYKKSFPEILKAHLVQYRQEKSFRKVFRIIKNGNANRDLQEIDKLSNNCVKFEFSKDDKFFIFKISSRELSHMIEFEQKIRNKFNSHKLDVIDDSDVWEIIYASKESHVRNTIENIEKCLKQCGLENIFLSFNGGKDCTVLLHLILVVIKKKYSNFTKPIFCLYVQSDSPFPEQDEFISQCQLYYNLEVVTIKSGIKDALQQTLLKYPHYKACFMGTRRTDPYSSSLQVFQMTDPNWPQIMRVSPLLDWHYSDIWDYLLFYKVPYCKLYDMGYTSLGNTVNTTKNPSLIYHDQFDGKEMYLPAYKLLKETKERNGRDSS
ncbi:FAD synthase [Asbolus verrucosus]|uniref:FAD synthase n=1 Tax=Asbolus verrucosus TaxID=1661398 RepID=A0A482W492_ASBVE|nr:FAD synthase [Asbolus verrucosus]